MHQIQIHQFSRSAHYGDGITNGMLYLQKILQNFGFISNIYVENNQPELDNSVLHYSKIDTTNKNQILFIHYSIYYDFSLWVDALDVQKHIIYHNITPYTFFPKGSETYEMCKRGKEILPQLAQKFQGAIGVSNLNTQELEETNFHEPKTIPLLIDVNKVTSAPFNAELFDKISPEFNMIFIGRIAQNKAQHDLIEIANAYKSIADDFRLYIIGGVTDEPYHQKLQEKIEEYALQENVILAGKISNEDLYAYYRGANLFLCMSEHEGFGMPLVESMLFDLPVLAYNSSNIKSTLNGGGILLDTKEPAYIASLIDILRFNPDFKTEILNTQREAREIYKNDVVAQELESYLKGFKIEVPIPTQEKREFQIHQFSPALHSGDGVTNGILYTQRILKELGFVSHVYAEDYKDDIATQVFHFSQIDKTNKNQMLLIHYAFYYDFSVWIDALDIPKHIIYHNVTPYTFFERGSYLYEMCKKAKDILPELASGFDGAIGDSPLNTSELKEANFYQPKTIPLLVDANTILATPYNQELVEKLQKSFNIIFIGRVTRHKAQHDLIEIANAYAKIDKDFKLYIIGGIVEEEYEKELQKKIKNYSLEQNIIITGKVTNEDLYAYYRGASLFLCMSEHEGFGMPLVESMLFNLPVFAYNSSNVKSTLNGGGVLFDEKSPQAIASTIEKLKNSTTFKAEILEAQKSAKNIYLNDVVKEELVTYLKSFHLFEKLSEKENEKRVRYQFEGPFDSSYSLAMLNRNSALAFEREFADQVALFSTEGPGDFEPSETFLQENPLVKKLHKKSTKAKQCDVVLRNLYPPRVSGMKGELNILNLYAWEESGFPFEYVDDFNQNLDGITAVSQFTKDVLEKNGVRVPIKIIPNSVDHILEVESQTVSLKTKKTFKFLHISSCFPRKGVDVLLQAYTEAFTKDDDVTLIIKTFPNPHNDVEEQIRELQKNNPAMPEIELINKDLDDASIKWLYENSDALVAPSRGEGFGLPMAEAMLLNLPVITTGYGGQVDFCKEENSWLIEFEYAQAQTHLGLFNSYWVEPSKKDLKELLQTLATLNKQELKQKTQKAYELVSKELCWSNYVEKTLSFIKELQDKKVFFEAQKEIAWISSYNTKCGIASYSEFIINNLETTHYKTTIFASHTDEFLEESKEKNIIRCWNNRYDTDNSELIEQITTKNYASVVINFNFGFFSMPNLASIIEEVKKADKKMTIIFHSVADVKIKGQESSLSSIITALQKADHLLVHTVDDLNRLKSLGLTNIDLLAHGVQNISHMKEEKKDDKFTIASYGFMLPHKGILELIEAYAQLHKIFPKTQLLLVNALYPADVSKEYAKLCQSKVDELNLTSSVIFKTDFLSDDATFELLSPADLIVLPYHQTQESSSASVRHALATRKTVLCTKQAIFDDVKDIVHFSRSSKSSDLVESITKIIKDNKLLNSKNEKQNRWIEEHDWQRVSRKFEHFI